MRPRLSASVIVALLHAGLLFGRVPGLDTSASAWRSQQPEPTATPSHATHMLYDSAQRQVVLLTASDAAPSLQLWRWTAQQWRMDPVTGPPARELGAAATDLRRNRIVLHGGMGLENREDRRSDTWEWDGETWHQMSDATIGSRDHHAMAYDERRGRTVMYGGVRSGDSLETSTCEWDGTTWRQVATQGLGGRAHFAMVYDSTRERVVLFGGFSDGYRVLADTWVWDGSTWTKIADTGPPPRTHHRMAFDSQAGVVVLFGGLRAGKPTEALDDTWVLDGQQWRALQTPGPEKRSGHVMAYDRLRRRTMLYGGSSFDGRVVTNHDDTWEWDGKHWSEIHPGRRTLRHVGMK